MAVEDNLYGGGNVAALGGQGDANPVAGLAVAGLYLPGPVEVVECLIPALLAPHQDSAVELYLGAIPTHLQIRCLAS